MKNFIFRYDHNPKNKNLHQVILLYKSAQSFFLKASATS